MPVQEAPPLPNPETLRPLPINPAELGSVALHDETVIDVDLAPAPTDFDIEAATEILQANANGVDAHLEDVGRVHDIGEAYAQAEQENGFVRDVEQAHEMAELENEIFDVYEEAQKENEILDAYNEAAAENETRIAKQQEEKEAAARAAEAEEKPSDIREQAKEALKQNGHIAELPFGTQVQKDPQTGNIFVILPDVVKVIEPRIDGKPYITDYVYLRDKGVLKVSTEGSSNRGVSVQNGDYVPMSQIPEGYSPPAADIVALPRMAARALGFSQAVFIPNDPRRRRDANFAA
jgi:hypothetical protein